MRVEIVIRDEDITPYEKEIPIRQMLISVLKDERFEKITVLP